MLRDRKMNVKIKESGNLWGRDMGVEEGTGK